MASSLIIRCTTHLKDATGTLHLIVSVPRLHSASTLDRYFPPPPLTAPLPPLPVVQVALALAGLQVSRPDQQPYSSVITVGAA
eukprot:7668681-Pyramimonas_sp.AAC.1